MSLYNSLVTKLCASSLIVNEQSCLRGRRIYGWEVRLGNMWYCTWWEFAITALKSSSSVSCTRCDTEGSRELYRLSLTPRRRNADSKTDGQRDRQTRRDGITSSGKNWHNRLYVSNGVILGGVVKNRWSAKFLQRSPLQRMQVRLLFLLPYSIWSSLNFGRLVV